MREGEVKKKGERCVVAVKCVKYRAFGNRQLQPLGTHHTFIADITFSPYTNYIYTSIYAHNT